MYRDVVPVLAYHGISGSSTYLTVSRSLFAEQMAALKAGGFHTITIKQYAAYVQGDWAVLPPRPILLTFDDGRLDAYRAADAILRAAHFHATDLVVPGWVSSHPQFSLSWAEMEQMSVSGTWDIQEHFGYGEESVPVNATGRRDGAFGFLEYFDSSSNNGGNLETFSQFQRRFTTNMLWGEQQLRAKIPGFQPIVMSIPESDYGQAGTNDERIPPYVLSWLDAHFPVVFGGDYLSRGTGRPFQIPGRFSPRLAYRLTMGPTETLPVLRCRLMDFVLNRPIWQEYQCLRLGHPGQVGAPSTPPLPAHAQRVVVGNTRGDIRYPLRRRH